MADPRFFTKQQPVTAGELAAHIKAEVKAGDADFLINDIASLSSAGESDVSFLENEKYFSELKSSRAGAVIISQEKAEAARQGIVCLISANPYQSFALAAQLFYPDALNGQAVTSDQVDFVHPEAKLEANVTVGLGAVIGAGAEIGSGTKIGPHSVIGPGCIIGRNSQIAAHVSITHAYIGDRVIIHSHVSIGQDGFGFAPNASGHIKIPQLGRVIIQNDVEIGAGCTIDRGAIPDTVIGEGTKIDNLCHLAHNTRLGRHCFMAGQSGLAGSASVGDYVMIGGKVGISGHLSIGNHVTIQGGSVVTKDLPDGAQVSGYPARDVNVWRRQQAMLSRLVKAGSSKKP